MKKGIALILAIILSFTSVGVIAAEGTASANAVEAINVEISEFDFTVTYSKDTAFEKATLQMFTKDFSNMIYMAEETPVETDGKYIATFETFSVDRTLPTDQYIIRASNGQTIETKTVDFFNYEQQINLFKAMRDAENDTDLSVAFEAGKTLVDYGYSTYSSFSPNWQGKIRASVLDIVWDMNKTDDEHMQQFFEYMDKMYEAVGILAETTATQVISKIDTTQMLTFDKTFYTQALITDKTYIGNIVVNHNYEQYADVEAAMLALYDQFDGAVLTYIIANCDWVTAEEVLKYYDTKTLIDVDFESKYNALNPNKKNSVFINLKNEKITDYTKVAERFAYYAQLAAQKPKDNTSGGSSSGGIGVVIPKPILTPTPTPTPIPTEISFNDLGSVSWAEDAITKLADKGAIAGDGNGNFNPQNSITREEFTKIIVAAFDIYDENAVENFDDVSDSDWSAKYIASAYQNGLISGIGDGIFGRKNAITREDAAVILYRIYQKTNEVVKSTKTFADAEAISDYAKDPISAMYQLKILNGYEDGNFYPKKNITRAEGAVMIYNLYKLYE